jgi:hypothetical protein
LDTYTKVKDENGLEFGYFSLIKGDFKVMAFDNNNKKQTVISYESNLDDAKKAIERFLQ